MEHRIMVLDEDMQESASMTSSQNFDSLSGSCIQSTPRVNLSEALHTLPDLGLKLSTTPSFLDKLDQLVQAQNFNSGDQANFNYDYAKGTAKSKDILQKIKAENFPISLLRIGSWQRVSKNEGDLVAKCYFAKRKLVWEFLENGLKSKIEIQWSDILSLRAVMLQDQPGILEIELNQPPSFHHEIDPQPRKHTQWRMVSDFTGGQALTFRRQHIEFPSGALDKPLEKLLRCDSRLFQLSRQSYPTLESPFFQKHTFGNDFSFDFGEQGSHVNLERQQFSFSNVPSQYFQTYQQTTKMNSISDQMPLWNQEMTNVRATISVQNNYMPAYVQQDMRNQLGGLVHTPSISQVHHPTVSFQEAERHQPRFQLLNDLQNMLLSNSQTEFSNGVSESNLYREGNFTNNTTNATANYVSESNLYRGGNPTSNTTNATANYGLNVVDEGNPTNNTTNATANYGQNMIDDIAVMSNNLSSSADSLIYPQAASWPQFFYSSVNSDPTMEYFDSANDFNDEWAWKS
ncbi:hypothetical protein CRYUN_Cryun05aG0004900 [Craigia yunnanensis]